MHDFARMLLDGQYIHNQGSLSIPMLDMLGQMWNPISNVFFQSLGWKRTPQLDLDPP